MRAGERIVAVQRREVAGRQLRDVVGAQLRVGGGEGAADNLLDGACVQVDAGAKARHRGDKLKAGIKQLFERKWGMMIPVSRGAAASCGCPAGGELRPAGHHFFFFLAVRHRSGSKSWECDGAPQALANHTQKHIHIPATMAVALGKRKRVEAKAPPVTKSNKRAAKEESDDDAEDLRDAFRRAFEAKFKPLDGAKKGAKAPAPVEEDDSDDSEDDEWEGISGEEDDDEEANTVEVVEVTGPMHSERISKGELKAFMVAPPPPPLYKKPKLNAPSSQSSKPPSAPKPAAEKDDKADDADAGESDAKNLKNDLALQRLLRESHLLDANSALAGPTGKNRHRATDLRIQALGSKGSVLAQEKMPMSHRKGMAAKATEREEKRRREARENGIILEREKRKGAEEEATGGKKRERGVGGPDVGRFSGGTLKLSKRDVASITGEGRGGRGGKGGRGGRGGRGGKKGRR